MRRWGEVRRNYYVVLNCVEIQNWCLYNFLNTLRMHNWCRVCRPRLTFDFSLLFSLFSNPNCQKMFSLVKENRIRSYAFYRSMHKKIKLTNLTVNRILQNFTYHSFQYIFFLAPQHKPTLGIPLSWFIPTPFRMKWKIPLKISTFDLWVSVDGTWFSISLLFCCTCFFFIGSKFSPWSCSFCMSF